jgi:N-acyl homoserine lactone hydrolase
VTTSVRLHPLLCGESLVPPTLLARRRPARLTALGIGVPRSRWVWIPVPAFLLEHPTEGPLVVDCGLDPGVQANPRESMGFIGDRLYDYRMHPDQGIAEQLRARGVEPADVQTVLMTHLHWDHTAGASQLAHAEFVTGAGELRAARRWGATLKAYRRAHLAGLRFREVDPAQPHGSFERTLDLFGDGSVRLVATPGHSAGHMSVLLTLEDRQALLCGDAAYTLAAIHDSVMPGIWDDLSAVRRSLTQIQSFTREHPDAVLIPGHDPDAWAGLDPVYG